MEEYTGLMGCPCKLTLHVGGVQEATMPTAPGALALTVPELTVAFAGASDVQLSGGLVSWFPRRSTTVAATVLDPPLAIVKEVLVCELPTWRLIDWIRHVSR
jgi:hypothetical protein